MSDSRSPCVIITGAGSGIGLACAEAFCLEGYTVIGVDLAFHEPTDAIHHRWIVDLSDRDSVDQIIFNLGTLGTGVDVLVNNAACQIERLFMETSVAEFEQIMNVNVKVPFFLSQKLCLSQPLHSIIHISSVHAKATSLGLSAYAVSKSALSSLTKSMAIELGPKGVRVNAILPGAIDTPMLRKGLDRAGDPDVAMEKLCRTSPLGKVGQASDVARLALFLADRERSGNITGVGMVCDGGVLAKLASES